MHTETIELAGSTPGTRQHLTVHRFGKAGASPKVYIQGALHADEVPAILVTQQLREMLQQHEASGRLQGEIILVPYANPLGLAQFSLSQHQGRFDLRDGGNFNRGYADLAGMLPADLGERLGTDAHQNTLYIRSAMREALASLRATTPTQDLKRQLLRQAADADIVLDLHCDTDAVLHLYALTPQATTAAELGACLGAQAVLLATESGDSPFDEACSRPWLLLREKYPQHPIELACFGATVELRGEADTDHGLARQDALAICQFLARQGALADIENVQALPTPLCMPTPLSGSEPITAPHAGVVVFLRRPGEQVQAGDAIADLVHPDTGAITTLRCQAAGLLYARCGSRWAGAGKRLAKIAGTSLARTGKLLSP